MGTWGRCHAVDSICPDVSCRDNVGAPCLELWLEGAGGCPTTLSGALGVLT